MSRKLRTRPAPPLHYESLTVRKDSGKPEYLPSHSLVYNEQGLGNFTKDFNVFYELYFEEQDALTDRECFLYRHLMSLASRGRGIVIRDYAAKLGTKPDSLIDRLDRLQDANLLYRVCREDEQGQPHDLVMQAPLSRERWNAGEGAVVLDQLARRVTHNLRRQLKRSFPGEQYRFSQRRINRAFDDDFERANRFTRLVLDVLFRHKATKNFDRKMFVDSLERAAVAYKFELGQPQWAAAFEIKDRYAPNIFSAPL